MSPEFKWIQWLVLETAKAAGLGIHDIEDEVCWIGSNFPGEIGKWGYSRYPKCSGKIPRAAIALMSEFWTRFTELMDDLAYLRNLVGNAESAIGMNIGRNTHDYYVARGHALCDVAEEAKYVINVFGRDYNDRSNREEYPYLLPVVIECMNKGKSARDCLGEDQGWFKRKIAKNMYKMGERLQDQLRVELGGKLPTFEAALGIEISAQTGKDVTGPGFCVTPPGVSVKAGATIGATKTYDAETDKLVSNSWLEGAFTLNLNGLPGAKLPAIQKLTDGGYGAIGVFKPRKYLSGGGSPEMTFTFDLFKGNAPDTLGGLVVKLGSHFPTMSYDTMFRNMQDEKMQQAITQSHVTDINIQGCSMSEPAKQGDSPSQTQIADCGQNLIGGFSDLVHLLDTAYDLLGNRDASFHIKGNIALEKNGASWRLKTGGLTLGLDIMNEYELSRVMEDMGGETLGATVSEFGDGHYYSGIKVNLGATAKLLGIC